MATGRVPPPLPPRQAPVQPLSPYDDAPPAYEEISTTSFHQDVISQSTDPRAVSTESLTPSDSNQQHDRRKLLLVFIHGFMGNETSFQSFPAHVHNLLTVLMSESHVVHTKIYPRYRSKRKITFARDDFSRWLEPHEDPKTDVVLLGHSMGGLLCAEVVTMPAEPPASRALKHRIVGSINFDVPFLGMHPGIISSGLASIFKPADDPKNDKVSSDLNPVTSNDGASSSSTSMSSMGRSDTLWGHDRPDPNFNPSFNNDVVLPIREGWRNALHFISKHSNDLTGATKQLVSSHLEFGGAMANYGELKSRYGRVRALEEEIPDVRKSIGQGSAIPARVRFINYYTASTGRPQKSKPEEEVAAGSLDELQKADSLSTDPHRAQSLSTSDEQQDDNIGTPAVLMKDEEDAGSEEDWQSAAGSLTVMDPESLTVMDPSPAPYESEEDNNEHEPEHTTKTANTSELTSPPPLSPTTSFAVSVPPVPDPPTAPPPLDVSYIQDSDTRKLVEKEHARSVKIYEKAVKDREKAIRDRAKLEEKREKKAQKETEKAQKDAIKAKEKAKATRAKETQKQAKLERKETEKEMSQMDQEEMRLEAERQRMEAEGRRMRGEPEPTVASSGRSTRSTERDDLSDTASTVPSLATDFTDLTLTETESRSMSSSIQPANNAKAKAKAKDKGPPKDRVFCMLPPKDSSGQRDPCWVRIFMKDVDEVGAHCGLFFIDETERYERLVGEVGERIEGWLKDDLGERRASSASRSGNY